MRTLSPPEVLDIKDAAKFLRVHKMTLYKLARSGEVPVKRVGGQWRFSRSRLAQWMGQGGND